MTESDSFSSLSALAASHLSRTCVQDTNTSSESDNSLPRRIAIPTLTGGWACSQSDTRLAPGRLPTLPSVSLSESPIKSVLEEQIANMLKAQDKKRKEDAENERLAKEMKQMKLQEEDCMIDLTAALQDAALFREQYESGPPKEEVLSSSSSFESLFQPKFINCDDEPQRTPTPEPLLPCTTDMSYILHQKIKRGKCSAFGRVLTSRLRPVAAPYLIEKVKHQIVPFDFKSKSPCDLVMYQLHGAYNKFMV